MSSEALVGPAAGSQPSPAPVGAMVSGRRVLAGQLVRFAAIGVVSTLAYSLLYLVLRPTTGAFPANLLALLLTAVANTAANRRVTFGVRGGPGVAGDHAVGLAALAAGLALTSGALAVLNLTHPRAGRASELAVLVVANAAATLLRFRRPAAADPPLRSFGADYTAAISRCPRSADRSSAG